MAALNAISVVSRPEELNMVPAVDCLLDVGDVTLITSTLVNAGPGGFATDGSPRRCAFLTFEHSESNALERYDPSLQYNAALYWFRRCEGDQNFFFEQIHASRPQWQYLGHDPTT